MNYLNACEILGINPDGDHELSELKRIYRQNALIYHPDKNPGSDTTSTFHKIKNAYDFLLIELGHKDSDNDEVDIDSYENEENSFSFQDSISSKINSYTNNVSIPRVDCRATMLMYLHEYQPSIRRQRLL